MYKVYLKPGKEESLKRFHPWIFSGAIARFDGEPEEGEEFMARAYVKIKYSDNTEEVIYSDVSNEPRTVRQVAKAYIADSNSNYGSLAEANKTLVDSFATAEGEEY